VNYVFAYAPERLFSYHTVVMAEMKRRGFSVEKKWENPLYRGKQCEPYTANPCNEITQWDGPIYPEHNRSYLMECLDNLLAKGIQIDTDEISIGYAQGQEAVNMNTERIQADFAYCEAIIKKHSNSFYYAFSQLPVEKANAVYAIYAFCRTADDCADSSQPHLEKLESLHRLKKELDLFREHAEVDHPLWRALRQVFTKYDMDIQPFYDQLTGQWMDMNFAIPKTMHELESYSYYVAGSVGLMLLPVLASKDVADLRPSAIHLGTAMQITNILRDIGEDFHTKQRIYLPEEEMERFRYTPEDLRHGFINENFVDLWEKLAKRAESLYDLFYSSIDLYDDDSKIPLLLSVGVYRGILDAVRSNDYDCFSKRNFVTKDNMIKISAAVYNCS